VYLVIFVHSLNSVYDLKGSLSISDEEDTINKMTKGQLNELREGIIRNLVQVGIPVFIYISGVSTAIVYSIPSKADPDETVL
jgi:hypothetical protein